MEIHLIGALVATFSILIVVFIIAIQQAAKIDQERHLKINRLKQ